MAAVAERVVPGGEGSFALDAVALFLVADLLAEFFFEREKQVEGDVGWLEFFGFGVGDVVGEGAVAGDAWGGGGLDLLASAAA
jgi:hypothetical protein